MTALYKEKNPSPVAAVQWFKAGDHPEVVPVIDNNPKRAGWGVITTKGGQKFVRPGEFVVKKGNQEHIVVQAKLFIERFQPLDPDNQEWSNAIIGVRLRQQQKLEREQSLAAIDTAVIPN